HGSDARAARHAPALRRHDGLPLRLPAAPEASAPRASAARRPPHGRDGGPFGPGDPRRARGRRAPHAAHRRRRHGDRARAARRAADGLPGGKGQAAPDASARPPAACMIESDGFYQIILFFADLGGTYAIAIMSNERDRVISITLSEAEWQAFVSRQPQPVNWL